MNKAFRLNRFLKLIGWILVGCDVAAIFIYGKGKLAIWSAVFMIISAIYLIYYPCIPSGSVKKKEAAQKDFIPLWWGGFLATIAIMIFMNETNFDFGAYMKITGCIAAVLVIPFVIKVVKMDGKPSLGYKFTAIFCICMIAFTVNYPLNVILTFDDAVHENVTVTEKRINSYRGALNVNQKGGEDLYSISERHYLYVKQKGSVKRYSVLRTQYATTSVGNQKKLYIQRSALGLKYYTIHEIPKL